MLGMVQLRVDQLGNGWITGEVTSVGNWERMIIGKQAMEDATIGKEADHQVPSCDLCGDD